jgi:hypothetical protein
MIDKSKQHYATLQKKAASSCGHRQNIRKQFVELRYAQIELSIADITVCSNMSIIV